MYNLTSGEQSEEEEIRRNRNMLQTRSGEIVHYNHHNIYANKQLFGTDPDRNRATWETPSSEAIPYRRKPLRRTCLLRDPAQTQVWSEQVWLNTTFISQGSRSWDKLAVET